MKNVVKVTLTAVLLVLIASGCLGVYKLLMGNYVENASFINLGLASICFIVIITLLIMGIKKTWTSLALVAVIAIQSCNYAKSNQQVLVSSDCGMSWQQIKAGDAVPKGGMNACYMKVVIPNFPMQGDSRFVTNLKDRVRASVHIDYDYSITNPLAFIKQAKYLGKANANADSDEALQNSAFEGAENIVIDKRIRDVGKGMFLLEDIVDMDQAEIENKLLVESNKILEALGVHLNFVTLTFDLDDQTRQAIDVSTAMKVYESKGLQEVGKAVMIERAGAARIVVEREKVAQGGAE